MSKKKTKSAKVEEAPKQLSIKTSKVVKKYNDPNVEVDYTVKITKAGAYEWYFKDIGKKFKVQLEGYAHYWIVTKEKVKGKGVIKMRPILMDDCVRIKTK